MVQGSVKVMVGLALVLAAASILLSAVLFTRVADQQHATNQSRVTITYQACDEQNQRHDKTFAKLDGLIAAIKSPHERARAEKNIGGTKDLLEALAPHQNCLALIKRRYGRKAHL